MNRNGFSQVIIFLGLMALSQIITPKISANELTFYYDPETGDVSLDTANTRSGEILTYYLQIIEDATDIRFRTENHIFLTSTSLSNTFPDFLGEVSFSPLSGLFTIGDVLPSGLSENLWSSLFYHPLGRAGYSPGIGLPDNDPVEFVYGKPEGEYDNRWDLIDPETLTWATAASLVYREATGEVLLDTRGDGGGHISGFRLRTDSIFLHENFAPPWNSPVMTNEDGKIDLLGNAIEPGFFSLGNILESGLTRNEYETRFTDAAFFGMRGFAGELDLETEAQAFNLVFEAVPEPRSAAQFFSAALIFGAGRRLRGFRTIAQR